MEAEELRIGNFVEVSAKTGMLQVDTPTNEKVNIRHLDDLVRGNKEWIYKPIPLTEEWLIKLGFKENHNKFRTDYYMFLKRWYISKSVKQDNIFYSLIIHKDYILTIKYVHQLQNLYFALTQTELTIK